MRPIVTLAGFGLMAAAAAPSYAAPITEAEANRIADATVKAWTSMDAGRIKALYAPNVVGFDMTVAPLATDRSTWDRMQDAFAAAKMDSADQRERKIQLVDANAFVVSGTWDVKSSSTPANNTTVRCTDVYERMSGGKWLVVNEHCSIAPKN